MSSSDYKISPPQFSTPCSLRVVDHPELTYEGGLLPALYVVSSCMKAGLDCQVFRQDVGHSILTFNKFGLDTSEDIEFALNALNEIYIEGMNKGIQEVRNYFSNVVDLMDAERRLIANQKVITKELADALVVYTGAPLAQVADEIKEFEEGGVGSMAIVDAVEARESASVPAASEAEPAQATPVPEDVVPQARRRDRRHRGGAV